MRQRERVTFNQVSASNCKVSAGLAGNRKSTVHRSVSGVNKLLDLQRTRQRLGAARAKDEPARRPLGAGKSHSNGAAPDRQGRSRFTDA
jgi:hypothetical protein